uniref:Uncharacterized protein n=1 Tax=Romanomermis culicivorax TaxID=13658 RepID=A0A915JGT8_ROMCU
MVGPLIDMGQLYFAVRCHRVPHGTKLCGYTSPHAQYGVVRCRTEPDEWLLYLTPYGVPGADFMKLTRAPAKPQLDL